MKFQSAGQIIEAMPGLAGSYRRVSTDSTGRAVYRKDEVFLHYVNDVAHRFEAWVFSDSADDMTGFVVNEDSDECVDNTPNTWEVLQVSQGRVGVMSTSESSVRTTPGSLTPAPP